MKEVCPCCQQEIKSPAPPGTGGEDMDSLFECGSCGSVLKWEKDTVQVVSQSKGEVSPPPPTEDASAEEEDGLAEAEAEAEEAKSLAEEISPPVAEEEATDPPVEADSVAENDIQGVEEISAPAEEASAIEEEADPPPENGIQDFSDVEEYGNAQASSQKGFLRYDLEISGIYSREIEEQIKAVLEDPRFKWSVAEILKTQKNGVLSIKNLNPIKAVCLISELSFLPVKLSWKQYMALNVTEE